MSPAVELGGEPPCPGCDGTLLVSRSSSPIYPWRCHAGWCDTDLFAEDGRSRDHTTDAETEARP